MPSAQDRYTVQAPAQAVADFHRARDALRRLTPPPVFVQPLRMDPLAEGSISEFRLWFGPLPVRWRAVHSNVNLAGGFVDTQQSGPFLTWKHTHAWRALDEHSTEMTERIEYAYRPGPRGWLARLLFAPPLLRLMFAHRRRAIRRACAPR